MFNDQSVTVFSDINGVVNKPQLESLQNIIREKDKECGSYLKLIHQLKQENTKYKNKASGGKSGGVRTLEDLMLKLQQTEGRNKDLQEEVLSLKRIQNE